MQDKRPEEQQPGRRSVLLVGNPALPLKGFDVALAVLAMVNRVLPLNVTWICQTHPTPTMVSGLASCGLRISLHVSPCQVGLTAGPVSFHNHCDSTEPAFALLSIPSRARIRGLCVLMMLWSILIYLAFALGW